MTRKRPRESCRELFPTLGIMTFPSFYLFNIVCHARKRLSLGLYSTVNEEQPYNLRNQIDIYRSAVHLQKVQRSADHAAAYYYNLLPQDLKSIPNPAFFHRVKEYFTQHSFYTFKEFVQR